MSARRCAGIGLVEALIALGILSLLFILLFDLFRGVNRGDAQVDRIVRRSISLALLRERLAWDLTRACGPGTVEGAGLTVAGDGRELELVTATIVAGAVKLERVKYRFDPGSGTIVRNDRPLPITGLEDARFARAGPSAPAVEVHLKGRGVDGTATVTLPLPTSLRAAPEWTVRKANRPG